MKIRRERNWNFSYCTDVTYCQNKHINISPCFFSDARNWVLKDSINNWQRALWLFTDIKHATHFINISSTNKIKRNFITCLKENKLHAEQNGQSSILRQGQALIFCDANLCLLQQPPMLVCSRCVPWGMAGCWWTYKNSNTNRLSLLIWHKSLVTAAKV